MDADAIDLTARPPQDICYQIVHDLRTLLPPSVSDAPEDAARRDRATIAHVVALKPADPEEAHLAVQYVAAGAQALDCLRLARECRGDPAMVLKCTAQVASMMRQARVWRTALIRRLGHVPHKLDVGPLLPELVHALVTGTTPVLRALDAKPPRPTAAAA